MMIRSKALTHLFAVACFISLSLFTSTSTLASSNEETKISPPSAKYIQNIDELSALWSYYKHTYIQNGRVVSLDENQITTSEGQSYAMLRAVWLNDRKTFKSVWNWTQNNLQVRKTDQLFAWKWKERVLDKNSATDADTDIALALLIASQRFSDPKYKQQALDILSDIWKYEIVSSSNGNYYVSSGNWAPQEKYTPLHIAYFAPYAYEFFAGIDSRHPWKKLVESTYQTLNWIYNEQKLKLPPEVIYLDRARNTLHLKHPETNKAASFSYDAFPIFWRVAVDASWYSRSQKELRQQMLSFFQTEWKNTGRLLDRYTLDGSPLSTHEGLPLYATVHSLAHIENSALAKNIRQYKLDPWWGKAIRGGKLPYYFQNWIWFDSAFELQIIRTYTEFLGFLRPFDFDSFKLYFPWEFFGVVIILYFFSRFHSYLKLAFLFGAFSLCIRYLVWRLGHSLNFLEVTGPVISFSLWLAEVYCFSTVLLLFVQVGLSGGKTSDSKPETPPDFSPSVDIFIPIYSESLEILEKTLIAAQAIRYQNKRVFVCDDSHRESVQNLAERLGASYIKGPKKHAKAGNLNNAIQHTYGELLLVFDTDHIPVSSFLEETVPYFADPKMGFIQTPHHFYNEDIFQRAFGTGLEKVPDEQDMFNHAIQSGRNHWNGAFFVGSGALFRRSAIEAIGGFKLISITEDIHTSQHLHARGWRSAFVNKDLAVGLTAENLASFIVQRRRWMLGCLQIFFKDNPLFCRGLTLRQKVGYFASLYYFFFPLARVIFWMTPLYFLFFHGHPIFSEVSILIAYLLPYVILLPLISSVLLPQWPRMLWGVAYEISCSFVLFRSIFDLFLPKNMGFKVTPKGITSKRRIFDWSSSQANLIVTGITLIAIGKGVMEFLAFGIEKDAYFFNLAWAIWNLILLLISLLVAWEKPQRRTEDRILKPIPCTLANSNFNFFGKTYDISLGGFSVSIPSAIEVPKTVQITLQDPQFETWSCRAELAHKKSGIRQHLYGFKFIEILPAQRHTLLLMTFANEDTWKSAHKKRIKTNFGMIINFIIGLFLNLKPPSIGLKITNKKQNINSNSSLIKTTKISTT
jgi:cellulose synthase (UDP-forming)